MLDMFYSNKNDDNIVVYDGIKNYTLRELKQLIVSEMEFLKLKNQNVIISSGDNFSFIIQFFAALFTNKDIYILSDRTRIKDFNSDYEILDSVFINETGEVDFPKIDINKPAIHFYTSGSSGKPKSITKSFYNVSKEAKDIVDELQINGNLTVVSTTTMCHMFGFTFHFLVPFYSGLIINTSEIAYPENVEDSNCILVSTPTFLTSVPKFEIPFKVNPVYIFTAGSKLNKSAYSFLEKNSKIIEIYGSTETGVIAHKSKYDDDFTLFNNVNLNVFEDNTQVQSDYFLDERVTVNDSIELNYRNIIIKNRSDRLYKIYEKRVCANELEEKLKNNEFVRDCYIIKVNDKLACLCALSPNGNNFLLKNNISILTKNLKQYLSMYSEVIPQRWKFIDEIPMTQLGKVDKKLIEHYFNINVSLPVILKRVITSQSVELSIFFYRQCNFFKGHFPEFKLVPGVAQLFFAKEFANNFFKTNIGQGQWKRIKFSNIIEPDSIVNLKLFKTDKTINFEFSSESKVYSSGTFLCENIFEGVS